MTTILGFDGGGLSIQLEFHLSFEQLVFYYCAWVFLKSSDIFSERFDYALRELSKGSWSHFNQSNVPEDKDFDGTDD